MREKSREQCLRILSRDLFYYVSIMSLLCLYPGILKSQKLHLKSLKNNVISADTDADGVLNKFDKDDDNDGILDVSEGFSPNIELLDSKSYQAIGVGAKGTLSSIDYNMPKGTDHRSMFVYITIEREHLNAIENYENRAEKKAPILKYGERFLKVHKGLKGKEFVRGFNLRENQENPDWTFALYVYSLENIKSEGIQRLDLSGFTIPKNKGDEMKVEIAVFDNVAWVESILPLGEKNMRGLKHSVKPYEVAVASPNQLPNMSVVRNLILSYTVGAEEFGVENTSTYAKSGAWTKISQGIVHNSNGSYILKKGKREFEPDGFFTSMESITGVDGENGKLEVSRNYKKKHVVSITSLLRLLPLKNSLDTDKDGIPDYLDLDSDNDGCLDALEGDGDLDVTKLRKSRGKVTVGNGSKSENKNLCGDKDCVTKDGVPIVEAREFTQGVGTSRLVSEVELIQDLEDRIVCISEYTEFSVTPIFSKGSGKISFQWQQSEDGVQWQNIAGASGIMQNKEDIRLSIENATDLDDGKFFRLSYIGENTPCQTSYSKVARLKTKEYPVAVILQDKDVVCEGSNAVFRIKASAGTTVYYRLDGEDRDIDISSDGVADIIIPNVKETKKLHLRSIYNGACRTGLNEQSKIEVKSAPKVMLSEDQVVCYGEIAYFQIKGDAGTIVVFTLDDDATRQIVTLPKSGVHSVMIDHVSEDTTLRLISVSNSSCTLKLDALSTMLLNKKTDIEVDNEQKKGVAVGDIVRYIIKGIPSAKLVYSFDGGVTTSTTEIPESGQRVLSRVAPMGKIGESVDFTLLKVFSPDEGCSRSMFFTTKVNILPFRKMFGIQVLDPKNNKLSDLSDIEKTTLMNTSVKVFRYHNSSSLADWDIHITNEPTSGKVELLDNRVYQYVPEEGYIGKDEFEYEVCNNEGNCVKALVFITVKCPEEMSKLFVPQFISPNADVINDEWNIDGLLYSTCDKEKNIKLHNKVLLFNKQGDLVWKKNDYMWDDERFLGLSNVSALDNLLPKGTYFYTIEIEGEVCKSGFLYITLEEGNTEYLDSFSF